MVKNNIDKGLLKAYLVEVMKTQPEISKVDFNKLPDKPGTTEVYRRNFGSWTLAKTLARQKSENTEAIKFDFKGAKTEKLITSLRREVKRLRKNELTIEEVRRYIFKLQDIKPTVPSWLISTKKRKVSIHGVPSLLLSDFHMGEVVVPEQVFGVNEFNLTIASERIRKVVENATDILTNHLKSDYPGLVLLLNGDFVSGNIHEELLVSNEKPIMPVVIETYNSLIWAIETLAKTVPNIMVFCCHGNHSRTFKKPIHKNAALSSYDWLIYTMLDRYFRDNNKINFQIAPNDDIQFKIYNHGYRLTHGGQFRGGQGFLGHIAPVARGEIRKRLAAESYGQNYDTLIIGHFHSYGMFKHVITNGSLVGYSEYSMNNNFPYERPVQALWLTHPKHGITFSCPVFCTSEALKKPKPWVSWPNVNVK